MTIEPLALSQDFNISLLLEPIPGKQGSGDSLRYTEAYDKIREARREDNEKLPQGVWKTELKKADWDEVDFLCQQALKTRSKDLQVAVWFMEARLHLEGIEGLTQGLELILGLSRIYWEEFYPQGFELRVGLYEWINSRLAEEIQFIPISLPSTGSSLSYQLIDLNEANRYEISLKKSSANEMEAHDGKQLSLSKISLSMNQTNTSFYQHLEKNCNISLKLLADLEDELRPHLGGEVSSFSKLREKVESVQRLAQHVLETRGELHEEKGSPIDPEIQFIPPKNPLVGFIENREQAYEILGEVAAYLERIEPHSPTPYLINRAISWGKMNLSQVVSDVTREGGNLSLLLDILGVKEGTS
jgi:type VI secretion system protein ImpA